MQEDRLGKLVAYAHKRWKIKLSKEASTACLDEEALACFKDGTLPKKEEEKAMRHILFCDKCRENIILDAQIQAAEREIPKEFIQLAKDICRGTARQDTLEVILALKEDFLELVRTSADFFETKDTNLQPVVLRAPAQRKISEEVQLVKYFGPLKVNLKIEKEELNKVRVNITLSEKKTGSPGKDLRVSLKDGAQELESYIAKQGLAVFTGVSSGEYEIEISDMHKKIGRILLELR